MSASQSTSSSIPPEYDVSLAELTAIITRAEPAIATIMKTEDAAERRALSLVIRLCTLELMHLYEKKAYGAAGDFSQPFTGREREMAEVQALYDRGIANGWADKAAGDAFDTLGTDITFGALMDAIRKDCDKASNK